MLYTILQTLVLIFTFESAFFLIRGNFVLSPQSIAELSQTRRDFNPYLVQSLASQFADTRVGGILLMSTFLVQVISLWKGPTIDDLGPANYLGLCFAVLVGILVFCGCWQASRFLAAKTVSEVQNIREAAPNGQ